MPKKTKAKFDPDNDSDQCAKCLPAKCCTYFAFEIDEPESRKDYESYLWMIAHQHVTMYIERKKWHIMIHTPCNFLQADNTCGIYETRPYLCREHSTKDCEYTSDEYGFTEHFKSYDELLMYIKETTNYRFKQQPTGIPSNFPALMKARIPTGAGSNGH